MGFRLAFMGSPAFAAASLAALLEAGRDVVCVYSQPPRPAGRGKGLRPTPVHAFAEGRGLPVRTPKSLKSPGEQAAFAALDLDLAVVAAYGLILPPAILAAPRLGCLNLHASLLPRWRGAAPIQRAILAGDALTGVQAMAMEEGLDTGPVYASREVAIEPSDTSATLHDKLMREGAGLIVETVASIEAGRARAVPQSETGVTYAAKITAAEARIDWSRPAVEVDRLIRAMAPQPGAWFEMPGPEGPVRMKALLSRVEDGAGPAGATLDEALRVACGAGAVRLLIVQREGKAALPASDYLRGTPIHQGVLLT